MKLYIHKVAVFSRPLTLFAAENKIGADIIDVEVFAGECQQEAFAKLNRSKQIPVLEDDGFYLTECSAILIHAPLNEFKKSLSGMSFVTLA